MNLSLIPEYATATMSGDTNIFKTETSAFFSRPSQMQVDDFIQAQHMLSTELSSVGGQKITEGSSK